MAKKSVRKKTTKSVCAVCERAIPHFWLGNIPKPKVSYNDRKEEGEIDVDERLKKTKEWEAIRSRYYVGSSHGRIAQRFAAICCECDNDEFSSYGNPVFCRCTRDNSHNNYELYPNHCFWSNVKQSLHPLGRLE